MAHEAACLFLRSTCAGDEKKHCVCVAPNDPFDCLECRDPLAAGLAIPTVSRNLRWARLVSNQRPLALHTVPVGDDDQQRIVEAWNSARDEEYRELAGECAKFLAEIDHEFEIEKFTLAELDEEEAELDKLRSWHGRIRTRDVHAAPAAAGVERALAQATAALERYSAAVFEHTQP
jgi:hypothetical protein